MPAHTDTRTIDLSHSSGFVGHRRRLSRIVAILAPALAWVGGSMVAAKAAQAGDDAPRSREEIVELVRGGRARCLRFI